MKLRHTGCALFLLLSLRMVGCSEAEDGPLQPPGDQGGSAGASRGGAGGATDGGSTGGTGTGKGGSGGTSGRDGGGVGGSAAAGGSTTTGGASGAGGSSAGAGGSSGKGGAAGAGGSSGGASGAGAGGTGPVADGGGVEGGTTGRPAGCPATADLLSDFEEGQGVVVAQGGRNGSWYTFADMVGTAPPTPNPVAGMLPAEAVPTGEQAMCSKYALHSTATGHPSYVGVGATFLASGTTRSAVDFSAYDGVSFRIKAGAGSQAVLFELLTKENQPPANGGTAAGPADQFNTRSVLLSAVPSAWTTIQIPFGLMGPRNLPSAQCVAGTFCEAPRLNRASMLGLQFSVYDQFPPDSGGYDLWIDDVKLFTGNAGLAPPPAGGTFPFPRDQSVGTCTKPAGASGKFLVDAYLKWKKTFVVTAGSGLRVQRPENNNDSVSEGIAYGMLIAVYMNDRTLFDGLFNYWTSNSATGTGAGPLMTWQVPGGTGSATDADQDAAFALLMAQKQWGGTYQSAATAMIANIWTNDIEASTFYPKGGSTFTGSGSALTNPSYFAPAYYRLFATADTGHAWNSVLSAVYTALASIQSKVSGGLVPAWCTSQCTGIGGGSYPDNNMYQYDSHRTPWRIGLDACWNNEPRAISYVTATTNFFAAQSKAAGLGGLADIYATSGSKGGTAKPNSMSLIGTAAAGAMAIAGSNADAKSFLDRSYQFLLDATYTPDPAAMAGATRAYTYYNATVGLLMALTMSGNFNSF
ncbi:MAG TPA: glycosyl hydrolase family 8 [Polyangiaceae bacterium]|nr:glycosyl hydrolase family 8 [Polyangiaceae bacterium]